VYPLTHKHIDSYCSLNTYQWQEFIKLLIEVFIYIPCLLCGEIHVLKIHALLWRKIRSPEEAANTDIIIIAIICRIAKKKGSQYTKRLLPPFLIPYCVISREAVVEYLCRFPDGTLHSRIASEMLGTVDTRTIHRHLHLALMEIKAATLLITRFFSEIPSLASVPDRGGDEPEWQYLGKTAEEMSRASVKVRPGTAVMLAPLVYVHAVSVYRRAKNPLTPPLSLVVRTVVFHDTS
jgi:hypothetical protein